MQLKIRVTQIVFDPIQKRALSRSMQLEASYLEALLYKCLVKQMEEMLFIGQVVYICPCAIQSIEVGLFL